MKPPKWLLNYINSVGATTPKASERGDKSPQRSEKNEPKPMQNSLKILLPSEISEYSENIQNIYIVTDKDPLKSKTPDFFLKSNTPDIIPKQKPLEVLKTTHCETTPWRSKRVFEAKKKKDISLGATRASIPIQSILKTTETKQIRNFKTKLCKYYPKCANTHCNFAHGSKELIKTVSWKI